MTRSVPYLCGIADSAIAEAGGAPLDALHHDADAICRCYDAIRPVAERLGLPAPRPRLAGFSYCHVSALGAEVVFAAGSEPNVLPILRSPEDIDRLVEPDDLMASGVIPQRLRTLEALLERRPDAVRDVGAHPEGPVTSAVLLMGPDFLVLPYHDPARAHALLSFCVESGLRLLQANREHFGLPDLPGTVQICDDFAGMFPPPLFEEFVLPYWERVYAGRAATERLLHSELLREEHLPYLDDLGIALFDPSADQYLSAELLRDKCPAPFMKRILSWEIRDHGARELQEMYRRIADCGPQRIHFSMSFLDEEPKIAALLEVARALAGET